MGGLSNDDAFLTITLFFYLLFVIIIGTLVYLLYFQKELFVCVRSSYGDCSSSVSGAGGCSESSV